MNQLNIIWITLFQNGCIKLITNALYITAEIINSKVSVHNEEEIDFFSYELQLLDILLVLQYRS